MMNTFFILHLFFRTQHRVSYSREGHYSIVYDWVPFIPMSKLCVTTDRRQNELAAVVDRRTIISHGFSHSYRIHAAQHNMNVILSMLKHL